ncbi:GMP reductase [Dirofilaria immitis]|nr:GMP reductase [Dirofilaria immitis]
MCRNRITLCQGQQLAVKLLEQVQLSRSNFITVLMPTIEYEPKLDFKDVLLRPKRSTLKSRADVDLKYVGIPIVASNMDTVGTFEVAEALSKKRLFTIIHKHYSIEQWMEFVDRIGLNQDTLSQIGISSGISDCDFTKLKKICEMIPELQYICLDVANGYSEVFVDFIRRVREKFPRHTIFAGNVVTGEMTEELILSGADIVKAPVQFVRHEKNWSWLSAAECCVGMCRRFTRLERACDERRRMHKPWRCCKSIWCWGRFRNGWRSFAGHDQCGGDIIEKDGQKYKLFYGMSSDTAMKKHEGNVAEYRASEGKTITVPFRGDISKTVQDLLGGLRSACTYTGATKLKELSKRATFVRVTQQTNEQYTTFEISTPELQKLNIRI